MIKNINVYNMVEAVMAARIPFKNRHLSDSYYLGFFDGVRVAFIGKKDIRFLENKILSKNSSSERKCLRQIMVSMDIKTSIKHWAHIDTYKVGTVRMSESTMNCLTKKELTQDDFARELDKKLLEYLNTLIGLYKSTDNEPVKRDIFNDLDNELPSGYLLESHYTCNYEVLRTMYRDRKNHKMWYWKDFFDDIKDIPYFDLLVKGV